jgi:putative ABC transport system substrate-binding protein
MAGGKTNSDLETLGPFVAGLAALGYVEGRDFRVDARYANDNDATLPALARELVALGPDLIVVNGGGAAVPAREATASIPIIGHFRPEQIAPLVGSLSRPVGNVTGIFTDQYALTAKHCDLLLEIVPTATRIGVLASTNSPDNAHRTREAATAAATLRKFTTVIVEVSRGDEVIPAFRSLADQRVHAIVVGNGMVWGDRSLAPRGAAEVGLPAVYNEQNYVVAGGGLISYGFSRNGTFARVASIADLLFRGAKPGDIPVEETSTFTMAINLKTAKSLGLTIPPTVLFRADLVIE